MKTPRIEYLTSKHTLSTQDANEVAQHMELADGIIESVAFLIEDDRGSPLVPEDVYEHLLNLINAWRTANSFKRYETCKHCNKQIGWSGSNWKHSETRTIECNPSTIAEPELQIVARDTSSP